MRRIVVLRPILVAVLALLISTLAFAQTQTKTAGETPAPQKASSPAAAATPQSDAAGEKMPVTTILDKSAPATRSTTTDGSDPLFEPPPLPRGTVSLIGGIVRSIDRVRNRFSILPFGGKSMTFHFDDRTHIYRDGVETTQMGIRKGDRVYVDTQLDKSFILARNVHVVTELQPADARGQLMRFNDRRSEMTMQDDLSRQPVRFRVDNATVIKKADSTGSATDLVTGALIAVRFSPDRGNRDVAREIIIYATPGTAYTFAGEITHLNLALGTLAIHNVSDDKSYEIQFDPSMSSSNLQLGAQATVQAEFTGRNYKARQIQVTQAAAKEQ